MDTQRTEAVEEEYQSIIARVQHSNEKSPRIRMQQMEEYYREVRRIYSFWDAERWNCLLIIGE